MSKIETHTARTEYDVTTVIGEKFVAVAYKKVKYLLPIEFWENKMSVKSNRDNMKWVDSGHKSLLTSMYQSFDATMMDAYTSGETNTRNFNYPTQPKNLLDVFEDDDRTIARIGDEGYLWMWDENDVLINRDVYVSIPTDSSYGYGSIDSIRKTVKENSRFVRKYTDQYDDDDDNVQFFVRLSQEEIEQCASKDSYNASLYIRGLLGIVKSESEVSESCDW